MNSITNEVLLEKIESLAKSTEKGFEGVHERQDKTNGNVIRNTEFRLKAVGTISTLKWIVGVLGVGNLVVLTQLFT